MWKSPVRNVLCCYLYDLFFPTLYCEFSTNQPSIRYLHLFVFPVLTVGTTLIWRFFFLIFSLLLFILISINPRQNSSPISNPHAPFSTCLQYKGNLGAIFCISADLPVLQLCCFPGLLTPVQEIQPRSAFQVLSSMIQNILFAVSKMFRLC